MPKKPKFSTCRTAGKRKLACCSKACAGLTKGKRKSCMKRCMPGPKKRKGRKRRKR